MKRADDPERDYARLVEDGYDRCAAAYNAARAGKPSDELAPLFERLPQGALVVDLGCGAGVTVAWALGSRFRVTGVDVSAAQLALARRQVPEATFVRCDMRRYDAPPASFDAVVSFYAIFHLPREEHEALFRRVHRWLRPGGLLLATLAWRDEPAYTEDGFYGVEMYRSNFGMDEYRAMLARCRFTALDVREAGTWAGESHPLVLAERPPSAAP